MGDWIGLSVIVLVLAGAVWGLSHLGKPRESLSEEEFEQRVQESHGTMSAGVAGMMYGLQKLMNPKAAEAVEARKDLQAGYYDESEQAGEGDDPDKSNEGDEREEGDDA